MRKGKGNRKRRTGQFRDLLYDSLWEQLLADSNRPWDPDLNWPRLPPAPSDPNWRQRFPIDYNFVHDRIATGGGIWDEEDLESLRVAGITHLMTGAVELERRVSDLADAAGMPVLANGIADDGKWKPVEWFAKTAAFVEEALQDPDSKIYLSCWSGKNRGPVSAYVALRVMGMSGTEAEAAIRKARPKVILLYLDDADAALEALSYGKSDRRRQLPDPKYESPRPRLTFAREASNEVHRYSWLPKSALADDLEGVDF